MQSVLLSLIILAVVAAAIYGGTRKTKGLDTFRAEAADQYNVWLASGSASQLGLSPGNCEIVKRSETVGEDDTVIHSYTLTLFLRNDTGQYVMFKSTPSGPYVKLVERSIAKVVLKDKFVPY